MMGLMGEMRERTGNILLDLGEEMPLQWST